MPNPKETPKKTYTYQEFLKKYLPGDEDSSKVKTPQEIGELIVKKAFEKFSSQSVSPSTH